MKKDVLQFDRERKTLTQMAGKIELQYKKEVDLLSAQIKEQSEKISDLQSTIEKQNKKC